MSTMDFSRVVWHKSSRSTQQGSCVEVATISDSGRRAHSVAVRDSKDPAGPALTFAPDAWQSFTAGIKAGELDL